MEITKLPKSDNIIKCSNDNCNNANYEGIVAKKTNLDFFRIRIGRSSNDLCKVCLNKLTIMGGRQNGKTTFSKKLEEFQKED